MGEYLIKKHFSNRRFYVSGEWKDALINSPKWEERTIIEMVTSVCDKVSLQVEISDILKEKKQKRREQNNQNQTQQNTGKKKKNKEKPASKTALEIIEEMNRADVEKLQKRREEKRRYQG